VNAPAPVAAQVSMSDICSTSNRSAVRVKYERASSCTSVSCG
jgi:hypothetical protein